MVASERGVVLARIGAPHGLKGEVRVKSFTEDPMALADYGPLHDAGGRLFTVRSARPSKGVLIVKFDGLDDRNAVEPLNGVELHVDRSVLPDDVGEDAYYHADLIGMAVIDEDGARIGKVRGVDDYGAGDVLDIALAGGGSELVMFTRQNVPQVDLDAKTMVVRLPASVEARADNAGKDR